MKFNFIYEGKRFFFITLVVKGRRALLSRRDRDKIVELLPAGRVVKDWWVTSHTRDVAVTASNFVIMPDHVHLLLIADFGKNPAFSWTAFGNLALLANPFLFPVRLTTKKTFAELEGEIAAAVAKARQGWVPVSGFISPGEKAVYRRLPVEPQVRWVKMLPHGLAPRYDPSVADSQQLAEGRVLILSAFPVSVPERPISRANCLAMNERIVALCEKAHALGDRGTQGIGSAAPEPPPNGPV